MTKHMREQPYICKRIKKLERYTQNNSLFELPPVNISSNKAKKLMKTNESTTGELNFILLNISIIYLIFYNLSYKNIILI